MDLVNFEEEKYSASTVARRNILHRVEEAQVQVSAELVANLRRMVNNPAFSDMVFVCNDGERVQASRLLLTGRSDVMKGMLIGGMVESSLSEIELPSISSPVLLCVLEFLYTGTLSDYYPRSWRMAWEVIIASRFFLLPNLDIMTRKFMLDQTSRVAGDLPTAASLLTEAMEWKAMCDEPGDETDISLRELVTILSSKWSEPSYLQNLSEDAFHYLLASTKSENDGELSFVEYLRFRQVIRWWSCHSDSFGSGGTEELLDFITLDEKRALSIYRNLENNLDSSESYLKDGGRLANAWRLSEESRCSVARLLSNIDFRRIHPVLLAAVVQPLKIVSLTEMFSAFRYHALKKPKIFQRNYCEWDYGDSHCTLDRGYTIAKLKRTIGFAVMVAPMSSSYAIYKWGFYVKEIPSGFCELGFTRERVGLEGKKLSQQFCAKVLDFLVAGAKIHSGVVDGQHRWRELGRSLTQGSIAIFEFNAYDSTCSLSLDGVDYGIVWEKIPRGTYYPAVSLGESRHRAPDGAITIELLAGFDML